MQKHIIKQIYALIKSEDKSNRKIEDIIFASKSKKRLIKEFIRIEKKNPKGSNLELIKTKTKAQIFDEITANKVEKYSIEIIKVDK